MQNTIKTPFHYITPHTRNVATSHKPWNWGTSMEVGDTLYLWRPAYNEYSKKIITEFVRDTDFDGTPGALFFISQSGTAYTASQLKDHIIKRVDGTWLYAWNGKDASEYAARYDVEAKSQ